MRKRDQKPRLTSRVSTVRCAYVHSPKPDGVYTTTNTGMQKGTLHAGCCARTPCLNSFKLGSASGAAPSRYSVFEVNVRIEQDSTSHERHDSRLLLKAPCLQLPAAILHG